MQNRPEHEPAQRHETVDANVRGLVRWGIGVFALLATGLLVSVVVFRYFVTHQALGPPASPFENARALPPAPLLQVTPAADLSHYLHQQNQRLDTYGWVDQKSGIVRIPIEQAMELLVQKGFPIENQAGEQATGQKAAPLAQPLGMRGRRADSRPSVSERKPASLIGRGK